MLAILCAIALSGCLKSGESRIPVDKRMTFVAGNYTMCLAEKSNLSDQKDCEPYILVPEGQGTFRAVNVKDDKGGRFIFNAYAFKTEGDDVSALIELDNDKNEFYYGYLRYNTANHSMIIDVPQCSSIADDALAALTNNGDIYYTKNAAGSQECIFKSLEGAINFVQIASKQVAVYVVTKDVR